MVPVVERLMQEGYHKCPATLIYTGRTMPARATWQGAVSKTKNKETSRKKKHPELKCQERVCTHESTWCKAAHTTGSHYHPAAAETNNQFILRR